MKRIEYNQLDDDVGQRLDELFKRQNSFIEVNPGKVIMPKQFCEIGEEVLDSAVHADDIWLVSFPRAGKFWRNEEINKYSITFGHNELFWLLAHYRMRIIVYPSI